LVWSHQEGEGRYNKLLRSSLFFGLSDGARIDVFRRANSGIISNEQVLVATQIHDTKWRSVRRKLAKELTKDPDGDAKFEFVFLLDDFTASGATLIRYEEDEKEWTGKLVRFWDEVSPRLDSHFTSNWTLVVHHYVASHDAQEKVREREDRIRRDRSSDWFSTPVVFSFGTVLSPELKLNESTDAEFLSLVDTYYDPSIETVHTMVGGSSVARGFGDCALPLVLDHNTPNNSVALLWAESEGKRGPAMRPLFRRRQRHV
jgi:hypothetical protein